MESDAAKTVSSVVSDGIVDPALYFSRAETPVRALFVLKEANDPNGGGWDLRDFLRDGGRWQTWNNVTRWATALGAAGGTPAYGMRVDETRRKEVLPHIAAVNLKKVPGESVSCREEILRAAKENAGLIRKQIEECRCDVIVCCGEGVAEGLEEAFVEGELVWAKCSGRRYGRCGDAIVLDFWHPAARKSKSAMVDEISRMHSAAKKEVWR